VARYNSTYFPVDDPLSVKNESITITLRSSDTTPEIGQPYYETTLPEKSRVDTVVPKLDIYVKGRNLVRYCQSCSLVVDFVSGYAPNLKRYR